MVEQEKLEWLSTKPGFPPSVGRDGCVGSELILVWLEFVRKCFLNGRASVPFSRGPSHARPFMGSTRGRHFPIKESFAHWRSVQIAQRSLSIRGSVKKSQGQGVIVAQVG